MPNQCVNTFHCGTHIPLWMVGRHPTQSEGIVSRKVQSPIIILYTYTYILLTYNYLLCSVIHYFTKEHNWIDRKIIPFLTKIMKHKWTQKMKPHRIHLVVDVCSLVDLNFEFYVNKGSDKVSASQPRDRGFEPQTGHDHDSLYDTSTG